MRAATVRHRTGPRPADSQPTDLFASVGHVINDAASAISSAPPEMLVLGIVIFFVGLIVLKRAF